MDCQHLPAFVEREHGQRRREPKSVHPRSRQKHAGARRYGSDAEQTLPEGDPNIDGATELPGYFNDDRNWELWAIRCYPSGSYGQGKTTQAAGTPQQSKPRSQAQRGPRLIPTLPIGGMF